ncbi:uncharacterized protein LOC142634107 [Castanea sativa]|uniref:uncharacterized protein LOC142634107 n=1 Tax=Castanea sativa TaxID=21020 RepID=UPI003F64CD55
MGTMSGSRIPGDQRQITLALPLHLVDVITVGDGVQIFADASCMYSKNTRHQITSVDSALCCRILHHNLLEDQLHLLVPQLLLPLITQQRLHYNMPILPGQVQT